MVNLLPTNDSKRVLWEHRRRIGIVALLLASCAAVLALLFVVPSAIITWSGAGGFDTQLEATKTLVDLQRKQGGGDVISDISTRADLLAASLSQRTPTSVLEDIVPRIPSGVSVRQFSYSLGEKDVTISVLGTAETRNALIQFGSNLRQSPLFSRVDVPIASLAKSEDIEFTLTLSLESFVAVESYISGQGAQKTTSEELLTGTSTQPEL